MKQFWIGVLLGMSMGVLGFLGLQDYSCKGKKEKIQLSLGVVTGIFLMVGGCLAIALPIALKN